MKIHKHTYFFVLEIAALQVGEIYDDLPTHCTLVHRFWSDLSVEELATGVRKILAATSPVALIFAEEELLGPKKTTVNKIELTLQLQQLHTQLYDQLTKQGVEYTAPGWVGGGYIAHVSKRQEATFATGDTHDCTAICLVEAEVEGYGRQRLIRAKFNLG